MKRALNKGVKKYVKLLWGKRSMPDSGAVGYPAVLAGALCRPRASISSARGLLPRGTWLPRECYSPVATPRAGLRTAPSGLDAGVMAPSDPS